MDFNVAIRGAFGLTVPTSAVCLPRWQQEHLEQDASSFYSRPRHRSQRIYWSDRFIPARSVMDLEHYHYLMTDELTAKCSRNRYADVLAANLLQGHTALSPSRPLLGIRRSALRGENHGRGGVCHRDDLHTLLPLRNPPLRSATVHQRRTPWSPSRILDAPELRDDFYVNLVDWSSSNTLATALGQSLYLYSATTEKVQELKPCCISTTDYVSSVAWARTASGSSTSQLAVGISNSQLQLWDAEKELIVRALRGHHACVGALAWRDGDTLASGSQDAQILIHDLRASEHVVATLKQHEERVCGLAWAPDGATLASGANDNRLCLWDGAMLGSHGPRSSHRDHCAAVRALAWSPWERHVLATGGGTADGSIKLWQSSISRLRRSVATHSQVCALLWSRSTRELLSAHGHRSHSNQLTLWKASNLTRIDDLVGHKARVLQLALSPDGSTVVSASADETLRFWDVFPSSRRNQKPVSGWSSSVLSGAVIR